MKAKKVDRIINAALASRRLEPSPELWEQLEHQLLKPATPFKKQRYFRYAALLILLFGLSSVFYFWEANLSIYSCETGNHSGTRNRSRTAASFP